MLLQATLFLNHPSLVIRIDRGKALNLISSLVVDIFEKP